jgi:hypothetical protein
LKQSRVSWNRRLANLIKVMERYSSDFCTSVAAEQMLGENYNLINTQDPYEFVVLYYLLPLGCTSCGVEAEFINEIDFEFCSRQWIEEAARLLKHGGWKAYDAPFGYHDVRIECPDCAFNSLITNQSKYTQND